MNNRTFETHSFYCLNCGQCALSCMRNRGQRREKGHRKICYCPYCKTKINCYECYDELDVYEFKEAFEQRLFKQEAEESLKYVKENDIDE